MTSTQLLASIPEGSRSFLRAPRTPAQCPISCVVAKTVRSHGGVWRGHALYIISDPRGHIVEIIEGTSEGIEPRVFARYPWFSTRETERYPSISLQTWPMVVNVSPAEYKRLAGLEPWSENASRLRAAADRRESYSAVCDAIDTLRMNGTGTHPLDGLRSAVIYHRTRARGGDQVSEHLRRAMHAFVRDGLAQLVSDPAQIMPDGKTHVGDVFGKYRATDLTPPYGWYRGVDVGAGNGGL